MSLKNTLGWQQNPLFIMDGTAFLYRGYYANPNMARSDGFPTGALYIVGKTILKILKEEKPEFFLFLLDGKGPNFRHDMFPAYKANRPPAPEALVQQLEPLKRLVASLGIHVEVSDNCEADDCIAALAARTSPERPVVIVGMDKDLKQCLQENVVMWSPGSGAKPDALLTRQGFIEETGLTPEQWPDVQALIGDSSDNVPGVPGVGQKTAEKIFLEYPSLEAIRDNFASLSPSLQKKFDGHLEAMFLYRRLTTLDTAACPHLALADLSIQPMPRNGAEASTLFTEFEMSSLKKELDRLIALQAAGLPQPLAEKPKKEKNVSHETTPKAKAENQGQLSLFGENTNQDTSASSITSQKDMGESTSPSETILPLSTSPMPVLELPPVQWADSTNSLPDTTGKRVAFVPKLVWEKAEEQEPNFSLLVEGTETEILFSGTYGLKEYLAKAASLIVPDSKALIRAGFENMPYFDLGLAAYLLAPEDRDYGWPRLMAIEQENSGLPLTHPAHIALSLCKRQKPQLEGTGLLPLLENMEQPLVSVLAHMEEEGILVDTASLTSYLAEVETELARLTENIYQAAGGPFNIRSAQQIGDVLYKRLGLKAAKNTATVQASTAANVLEELSGAHPMVDALLTFRKLEKLRSTYLEPLPRYIEADGRIHTHFNQCATATGRLSSSAPNLQNIPIRGENGPRMRACFIAKPGYALIAADYSQIELRVLAHFSKDPNLVEAFRNNEDIHRRTAALLHDIPAEQVTPAQRRAAKTINFGLIYGMGARKLAADLSVPFADAKAFIETYFARFASIKAFFDSVVEMARTEGFVTTLAGRRRPLPDMQSTKPQLRAAAERQAVNTLIQGSAADIIKTAMLDAAKNKELQALGATMLLQVHDELVFEVPEAHAIEAGRVIDQIMEASGKGYNLSVPLLVDWGHGKTWAEAH